MTYANFTNAKLEMTWFYDYFWYQYQPVGNDMSYAILTGADVSYADFSYSKLYRIISGGLTYAEGAEPTLTSEPYQGPWAVINGYIVAQGANLTGADLSNQNLSGLEMALTVLTNANLTNTNLTNANLINVQLINTNLTNANLTNADMRYAIVSDVIWNNTTCVDGTNSDLHLEGNCFGPMDHDRDGLADTTDLDDDGDGTPDYIDIAPLDAGNNSEIPLQTDGNYKGTTIRDGQTVQ